MTITQSILKQWLSYDKNTGIFTWIRSPNWKIKIGDVAGHNREKGYVSITIDGREYKAHRLAFIYVTGSLPENEVDHINGIKDDNRFCNLRSATKQQNGFNKKKNVKNHSGFKGVCWHKPSKKWVAQATINGKTKYLGSFIDPQKASEAYQRFSIDNHGQFLNK